MTKGGRGHRFRSVIGDWSFVGDWGLVITPSPLTFARRVKIALVILHADPAKGGAEGYTVNLAGSLKRRGHDVTLLATSFAPSAEVVCNTKLSQRGLSRLGRYHTFVSSLDAHLEKTKYD